MWQRCQYSFAVVWRTAGPGEERRAYIKEWLDDLGRWLEGQPVTANGQTHRLERYPPIGGGRRIRRITRQTAAALDSVDDESHTETWAVVLTALYENEF